MNAIRCLAETVEKLKEDGLDGIIEKRMSEFSGLGKSSARDIFKELCFCLLTANYSAEGGIRIQREVGDGFIEWPPERLSSELKRLGHRFPKARAGYIIGARKHIGEMERLMAMQGKDARRWLSDNVKGLGMKEASHFLRNVGFTDVAIIDFHIVDILVRNGLIERPRTMTNKRYLEIEGVLGRLAEELGMNMGELDLYLWYCETGKVLK